jgi:hypothetical protein
LTSRAPTPSPVRTRGRTYRREHWNRRRPWRADGGWTASSSSPPRCRDDEDDEQDGPGVISGTPGHPTFYRSVAYWLMRASAVRLYIRSI